MAGLFSRFSKRTRASRANELGRQLNDQRQIAAAIALCKECSEGTPHDHDEHQSPRLEAKGSHRVAVAARTEAEVRELLDQWRPHSGGARISSIDLVFSRGD